MTTSEQTMHESYHVDFEIDETGTKVPVMVANPSCPYCREGTCTALRSRFGKDIDQLGAGIADLDKIVDTHLSKYKALAESHARLVSALSTLLPPIIAAHTAWKLKQDFELTIDESALSGAQAALTRARAL